MAILPLQYRDMAQKARAAAETETLANAKKLHLQSAERLERMADDLELVAEAKSRNDAAKAAAAS